MYKKEIKKGGSAGVSLLKAPGGGVKCPGQVVPTISRQEDLKDHAYV